MRAQRNGVLLTRVNFGVSVLFIASFGIFMTTMVLRISHLPNPMIDAVIPNGDTVDE